MMIKGKRWSAREINGEIIVEEKENNNMFSKIKEKAIDIKEYADSFVRACKLGNEMKKVVKRIKFMMTESDIDFDLAYAIATIRLDKEIYSDEFVKWRIGVIVNGEL